MLTVAGNPGPAAAELAEALAGSTVDHPMIGQPAPEFQLKTTAGEIVRLADLRGEMVVIHFGTSW